MKTIAAALLILLFVIPLPAHHSVTKEFDQTKAKRIQGVIKKVEWMNPHSSIIFETKDANGIHTIWRVEILSATGLWRERGIRPVDLELAKPCAMEIWPARDGSKTAYGRTLTFTAGKSFDFHSRFFDPIPLSVPAK